MIPEISKDVEEKLQKELDLYCVKIKDRIQVFKEQNPGQKLPIMLTKDGFHWMNRAERRKKKVGM